MNMKILTKINLLIITLLIISCSSNNDESSSNNNGSEITIQTVTPNYGYPGDEITLNMSSPILPNSNPSISYPNNQQAIITSTNGNVIKHKVPFNSNDGEKRLTLNNKVLSFSFTYLDMFINCTNCKEKAYQNIEQGEIESIIVDMFKDTNNYFLIALSKNSNQEIKTYLLKTDFNFNLLSTVLLFNNEPRSKIIFENSRFIIDNLNGVYAYNYSGNLIWSYTSSLNAGEGSGQMGFLTKSIIKKDTNYYLIQNAQGSIQNPIKIVKLNSNGQLIKSIEIPNIAPQNYGQTAQSISEINNKIVVFNSSGYTNNYYYGYAVLDNDILVKNSVNFVRVTGSDFYIENNSIIFSKPNTNILNQLVKATLDINNNFQVDWVKDNYQGAVIKYNSKYLIIQSDKILISNNINFDNPKILKSSENYFNSGGGFGNCRYYGSDLFRFGKRTLGGIIIYKSFIGKSDLNYITN